MSQLIVKAWDCSKFLRIEFQYVIMSIGKVIMFVTNNYVTLYLQCDVYFCCVLYSLYMTIYPPTTFTQDHELLYKINDKHLYSSQLYLYLGGSKITRYTVHPTHTNTITVLQSSHSHFRCGVCLDTWMLPVHKELYENGSVVQQPLIFINSYDFQWKQNIEQMTKMTQPPNEQGISTSRILTLM